LNTHRQGGNEESEDVIEYEIWHSRLNIEVKEPWIKIDQISILSLVSGALGSVLSVPWLYATVTARIRSAREKQEKEEGKPKILIP
jgi:hypothetical protein